MTRSSTARGRSCGRCPETGGSSWPTCGPTSPTCGRTPASSCCSWARSSPRTPSGPRAGHWTGGIWMTPHTAASCSWSPTSTPATGSWRRSGRSTATRPASSGSTPTTPRATCCPSSATAHPAGRPRTAGRRRPGRRWPAWPTSPACRTTATGSACRGAAAGGRSSTPTRRATAAPASATGVGSRRSSSRGTGSPSPPSWRRRRWARSGSCTRAERRPLVPDAAVSIPAPPRGCSPRAGARPGILCPLPRSRRSGRLTRTRKQRSMSHGLRRVLTAAAVSRMLLTACSSIVTGSASPGEGVPVDVTTEEFPITAAAEGDPVDQAARNALVDLYTFWEQAYPEAFGQDFRPLQGGVYSVDLADLDRSQFPDGIGCGQDPTNVEGTGAFFCAAPDRPNSDAISYDKNFLTELADDYGRSLVPFVMAHEFGHALQYRFDGLDGESINVETQADCLAGAWTAWVVAGNADHVVIRQPELDKIIRGYLITADAVGTDPNRDGAHGSYFDRVSAITEGYDDGAAACRDDFGPERIFTAQEF